MTIKIRPKTLLGVALITLVGVAAYRVGGALSSDAVGMVLGLLIGILAGVPSALLILLNASRPEVPLPLPQLHCLWVRDIRDGTPTGQMAYVDVDAGVVMTPQQAWERTSHSR